MTEQTILRPKSLPAITGLSSATIWRLIKAGAFPKPFKISAQATGFDRREIEQWVESRKSTRS